MSSNQKNIPLILVAGGCLLLGGLVVKRFLSKGRNEAVVAAIVPMAQPSPTPIAQVVPQDAASEDSKLDQEEALDSDEPLPPVAAATPAGAPAMSIPSNIKVVKLQDMKQTQEAMAKIAKMGSLPSGFGDAAGKRQEVLAKGFESEQNARAAMAELENCVNEASQPIDQSKISLPAGGVAQIQQERQNSKTQCANTAKQLSERYPALREQYRQKF